MKPIVVVVGMKRSGTSLCAQGLERLGVSFGSPLIEADSANVKGYYEHEDLVRNQSLLVHTCYDRGGWNGIGELRELDGSVNAHDELALKLEAIIYEGMRLNELFGVKLPWLQRIPSAWGAIFTEVEAAPIFIHAIRRPLHVYKSILRANKTEHKDTMGAYLMFLRKWAWANAALFEYEPACEIWFNEWGEDVDGTMKKLADAIGRDTVSTEGLLL